MKKANVYSLDGTPVRNIDLPPQFSTPYRPDVIRRAVISLQTLRLNPHGVNKLAGKRTTAESWGPGHGVSRVPRVKGRGSLRSSQGAFAPSTVGGYRAHAPRAEKVLIERINKKERRLAIRSAIAATANKDLVSSRGHRISDVPELPLIVESEVENLTKTSDVIDLFLKLGLAEDLDRAQKRKIRAGKGKMRGRKYKRAKSVLIITNGPSELMKAARNLPGVDVVNVHSLNVELLAPGTYPGRLCLWTEGAIKALAEEKLFM